MLVISHINILHCSLLYYRYKGIIPDDIIKIIFAKMRENNISIICGLARSLILADGKLIEFGLVDLAEYYRSLKNIQWFEYGDLAESDTDIAISNGKIHTFNHNAVQFNELLTSKNISGIQKIVTYKYSKYHRCIVATKKGIYAMGKQKYNTLYGVEERILCYECSWINAKKIKHWDSQNACILDTRGIIYINNNNVDKPFVNVNSCISKRGIVFGKVVDFDCCGDTLVIVNEHGRVLTINMESSSPDYNNLAEIKTTEFVISISCGKNHIVLLTRSGKLLGLGSNRSGQLGLGHKIDHESELTIIKEVIDAHIVECGDYYTIAIAYKGTYVFGRNNCCQLGFNSNGKNVKKPHLLPNFRCIPNTLYV